MLEHSPSEHPIFILGARTRYIHKFEVCPYLIFPVFVFALIIRVHKIADSYVGI